MRTVCRRSTGGSASSRRSSPSRSRAPAGLSRNLGRFTPAGLAQGTKQGAAPPSHPFFLLCERLEQAGLGATRALESWRLGLGHKLVGSRPRRARRAQGSARRSLLR